MKKMLCFRLDDICPGMRLDNLNRIEKIFDKYDLHPLLGVVPDNQDDNLMPALKNAGTGLENQAGTDCGGCDARSQSIAYEVTLSRLEDKGWEISMHGYQHIYSSEESGLLKANPFSEFAGVPYEKQYEMLKSGREILSSLGYDTDIFMAPGHTFDENTLKALAALGFKYITDGYTDVCYERGGLTFVPCSLSDPKEPAGVDTVCIHVNSWQEEDFDNLEDFLKKHRDICCDFKDIVSDARPHAYDRALARKEESYRRLKEQKNRAAASDKMQRYLKKSYSENKYVKLIKRVVFLPMLLGK